MGVPWSWLKGAVRIPFFILLVFTLTSILLLVYVMGIPPLFVVPDRLVIDVCGCSYLG